jgi:hypothetical protein
MADDPFAPVWIDLSDRFLALDTRRGRFAPLGRMEAGTATVVIDDRAGLIDGTLQPAGSLDPFNPAGPWYGKLEAMRPVRIRLDDGAGTISPVFYGYVNPIDGWKPIRHGPTSSAVVLELTDGSMPLAAVKMPDTAFGLFIAAPMPFAFQSPGLPPVDAWYKLGASPVVAPATSVPLYDSGPNRRQGSWHNATGGQPPVNPGDPDGALVFDGVNDYAYLVTGAIGTGPYWQISFWMLAGPQPATGATARRILWHGTAAAPSIVVSIWEVGQPNAGKLQVYSAGNRSGPVAAVWDKVSPSNYVTDAQPHRVTIAYTSTPGANGSGMLTVDVDGNTDLMSGGPDFLSFVQSAPGQWVAGAVPGGGGWYWGWLDEVAFLTGADYTMRQVPDAYDLGQVWGGYTTGTAFPLTFVPVYADDRARRVLDVAAWPAALRDVPVRADAGWADVEQLATDQVAGANALEMVQAAMDAEGGAAWFRADGRLYLRGALALGGAVLATFGPGFIETEDMEPSKGQVYNRVELTGIGAGITRAPRVQFDAVSEAKYRPSTYRATLEVASDAVLDARAYWTLQALKAPVPKVEQITLAPFLDTGHLAQAQARELEDKVRAHYVAPSGGYTLDLDARIAGIEHHATRESARVVYWLDTY